jgi:hypothetical protein
MAVGHISGPLLTANLLRNGRDLAFETDLLFLNVSDPDPLNFKVGIGTSSPAYLLDINGTSRSTNIKSTEVDIGNINIKLNTIKSSVGNLTLQAATNTDNIIISSKVESQYLVTLSGEIAVNTATNNQSYTTTGTGVITIASGTTGSINNITIGNTTPSTGNFTVVTVGASANTTRFPNAKLIISDTATSIQQNEIGNIGIIAEAVGAGATRNAGVYGVGYTAGAFTGQGVVGESHVSAADDTAPAVGVRGYANDIRTVGNNVGLYGDASSGIANYSLYLNSGDIYTAGAKTWYLTGNLTFNGAYSITIPTLALTNALPVTSGGTGVTTSTGTTNAVLSNTPTLVTPVLGDATATTINKVTITQPSASATLTISNSKTLTVNNSVTFTGTDNSTLTYGTGGTVAYTENKLSAFAATTSAELAGNITDETGTGSLVFANTPTLVTPVLGDATATTINKVTISQPSTGATLTIADGKTFTVSNKLTFTGTDNSSASFGTGGTVAYTENKLSAFAATTSAELADNITDETGTGSLVFANTPTLVTPVLGVAAATSINKLTITAPTTSSTLTVVDGSSLITSGAHSLTLTTTADTNVTFPTTGTLVNSDVQTLSSLSSVGTITTGTWSGLFGSVSGANLTNLTAGNLTGTIPSTVLGNSSIYIGTTQINLNRASGSLTLADVNFGTTDVTTSFTIPNGNTVSRPSTPAAGNIRYNTDTTNYEGYNGTDWSKMGSGLTPTPVKTASYTATEAQLVRCDSTASSFSVFLPSSPVDGNVVGIIDIATAGSFYLHPVSVVPSAGNTIEGASDLVMLDINNAYITFVYVSSTNNWKMQETPNMLSDYTLQVASTTVAGAVKVDGTTIVINNQGVISAIGGGGGGGSTLLSVIGSAPIISSGGTTPTISISQATASTDGYLSLTDWNTFNNKLSSIPIASAYALGGIKIGTGLTIDGSGTVNVTGSVLPAATTEVIGGIIVGSGLSIDIDGILSTSDFVTSVSGTSPITVSSGSSPTVSIAKATSSVNGYLSSTDWTTFNNKLSAVPMASASVLGGIKIGPGLSIDNSGIVTASSSYSLPIATAISIGGVKVDGTSIMIDSAGTISASMTYAMPVATTEMVGGVMIGTGLAIDSNGFLVATGNAVVTSLSNIAGGDTNRIPYQTSTDTTGFIVAATNGYLRFNGSTFSWELTGTVTSVSALSITTSGTDITSSVATGTTTPVITLNIPTASATNRGALSSTDWNAFNSKASTAVASTILNGLMSSGDKTKLDGIATGATANTGTVTGVSALTIGTAGTDIVSTVTTGTTTPVITLNIPTASATNRGALSSADWSTFNGKQAALSTASAIVSGILSSTDWSIFNNKASTLVATTTENGLMSSGDKTKLNGVASGATANTGTVTGVSALTIGTAGTDIASTVATGTTTPVITLNIPTASATNRGALSSADWSTFNGKQAALSTASASVSGILSSTDWTTFNGKASTTTATTSANGLMSSGDKTKLDGVASGATANTGTVTSVSALTISTTGTDIASTVATGTTTPVITLSIPTASATNRGALSSADWSTFNGKQAALSTASASVSGILSSTDWTTFNGKASTTTATTSANGLMSSDDKTKLNSVSVIEATTTISSTTAANTIDLTTVTNSTIIITCDTTANQAKVFNFTGTPSTTMTTTNIFSINVIVKNNVAISSLTWQRAGVTGNVKWPNGTIPPATLTIIGTGGFDVWTFFTIDGGATFVGSLSMYGVK